MAGLSLNRFNGLKAIAEGGCTFSKFKDQAFSGEFDEKLNRNKFASFFRMLNNECLKKHGLKWEALIEETPIGYKFLDHINLRII